LKANTEYVKTSIDIEIPFTKNPEHEFAISSERRVMQVTAKDLAEGVSGYTDYYGPSWIFYYLIIIADERIYRKGWLLITALALYMS
jgi:hypothetical protein